MNIGKESILIFLLSLNLLPIVFSFMKMSTEAQVEYEEDMDVYFTTGNRVKRSEDSYLFSEQYHLEFAIEGLEVYLRLEHNTNIQTNIPVLAMKWGSLNLKQIDSKQSSAFYQDFNTGAVFVVQQNETEGESMLGVLQVRNRDFVIKSKEDLSKRQGKTKFKIVKQKMKEINFTDSNIDDIAEPIIKSENWRQKRATGDNQIELLICVDFSIYQYWYDQSSALTDQEKETDAIETIKQFYAFVLNGIDVRFKNQQTTSYTVSVLFAGIIIAQTSSDSEWTESIKNNTVIPTQVVSFDALNNFRTWIQSNNGTIPGHDHAMLFTRYDLTHEDSGSSNAGLAFVSVICTTSSQSIVEDHFAFSMLTVAAHELGHSLGARHDGDNNACSSSDYYIMAASTSPLQDIATIPNQWKFSSCSTIYFTTYIDSLDSTLSNCMKDLHTGYNATALSQYLNDQPGQVYDADTQCKHISGPRSSFCQGVYNGDFTTICSRLYCRLPNDPNRCRSVLAAEGTLCGDQKWCQSGECKFDLQAPRGNADCLYGDIEGQVFTNQPWNCSEVASIAPNNCPTVATKCCEACAPHLPTTEMQPTTFITGMQTDMSSTITFRTDQPSTTTAEMTESITVSTESTTEQLSTFTSKLATTPKVVITTEQMSTTSSKMAESTTTDFRSTMEQMSKTSSKLTKSTDVGSSTEQMSTTTDVGSSTEQMSTTTYVGSSTEQMSTTTDDRSSTVQTSTTISTTDVGSTTEHTSTTSSKMAESTTTDFGSTMEQMSKTSSKLTKSRDVGSSTEQMSTTTDDRSPTVQTSTTISTTDVGSMTEHTSTTSSKMTESITPDVWSTIEQLSTTTGTPELTASTISENATATQKAPTTSPEMTDHTMTRIPDETPSTAITTKPSTTTEADSGVGRIFGREVFPCVLTLTAVFVFDSQLL